ncbi:sigma-E factor negative regulatory protein [Pseudidiomarina sp. 1APP75-27a]|uniref:sigma-E factor negative regulatory protein n=1 Tax=Pseudidiomarina terrestris TaxID=2820060 RepID=UPI002B05B7F6|nr:sigma-E factor negative regulatory protein [Pseudidiomarina sp. 1APP75-27a]MEA3587176.1 sigma-E factor negative regulatory protein [Pseudidiomarina sp. 1APP75-27a]
MTNRSYEQLSALLDNASETSREQEQELDTLLSDTEAQQVWGRYALIGRVMKGDAETHQPLDISAAVAAQVSAEAKPAKVVQGRFGKKTMQRWFAPAGSAAIAASVALVAVLSVQQANPVAPEETVQPAFATAPIGGRNPVSYNTVLQSNEPTQAELAQQSRLLQSYMLDHQQQLQLSLQAQQLNENLETNSKAQADSQPDADNPATGNDQ